MQRTPRSFLKNAKECKNVAFFWKKRMPNPAVVADKTIPLLQIYLLIL